MTGAGGRAEAGAGAVESPTRQQVYCSNFFCVTTCRLSLLKFVRSARVWQGCSRSSCFANGRLP
jgi:hypothetical protein